MSFIESLNAQLDEWFLLKHPVYETWSAGKLSVDTLRQYAREYYAHVSAFPRYISTLHAQCPSLKHRQILLENLMDEELGPDNHPELWLRFAEGIGMSRVECQSNEPHLLSTNTLIQGFFKLMQEGYATGLGALYAYERQTPAVAESKAEGLRMHYNCEDPKVLEFFTLHMHMDQKHTADLQHLLESLTPDEQAKAIKGAIAAARLLWGFLDGIEAIAA